MDDDWDLEDDTPSASTPTPPPPAVARAPVRNKFADEDAEDVDDDWDKSDDDKPKAKSSAVPAPAKKKKTLKQIIAEKEAKAAEARANGVAVGGDDEIMDTLTTQERRRLARERELEADLAVAGDLMGDLGVEDKALQAVLTSNPKTKEEFATLSQQIITAITSRHQSAPLYSAFVEQLSKDLCESLTAVQTRKVSSSLSVLGNTKQQEERDKASGKKKGGAKPKLGATKTVSRVDTEAYDDVLEDDDFM